jgi:hypothetical protein
MIRIAPAAISSGSVIFPLGTEITVQYLIGPPGHLAVDHRLAKSSD